MSLLRIARNLTLLVSTIGPILSGQTALAQHGGANPSRQPQPDEPAPQEFHGVAPRCASPHNFYLFSIHTRQEISSEAFRSRIQSLNMENRKRNIGFFLFLSASDWKGDYNRQNWKIFDGQGRSDTAIERHNIYRPVGDGFAVPKESAGINEEFVRHIITNKWLPERIYAHVARKTQFYFMERYAGLILNCQEYNALIIDRKHTKIGKRYHLYIVNGGGLHDHATFDQKAADATINLFSVSREAYLANVNQSLLPRAKELIRDVSCHRDLITRGLLYDITNYEILARELLSGNDRLNVPTFDREGKSHEGTYEVREWIKAFADKLLRTMRQCVTKDAVAADPKLTHPMFACLECTAEQIYSPRLVKLAALYAAKIAAVAKAHNVAYDANIYDYFEKNGTPIAAARAHLARHGLGTMNLDFEEVRDGAPLPVEILKVVNDRLLQTCDFLSIVGPLSTGNNPVAPIMATEAKPEAGHCVIRTAGVVAAIRIFNVSISSCTADGGSYQCRFDANFGMTTTPPMPIFGGALRNLPSHNLVWQFTKAGTQWQGKPLGRPK